jgi:hypothetical protein
VEVEPGVIREKALHMATLVNGEVIQDDVDLLLAHGGKETLQEGHESRAVVLVNGSAKHLACTGVECGEQREGSMPVVLEPVPLQSPRRERQDRIKTVQRLDLGLLIQGEDRRIPS